MSVTSLKKLDRTGTHTDQDLSQELETTPPSKKNTKPTAPSDHTISILSTEFQQAFLDNDQADIRTLLDQFDF